MSDVSAYKIDTSFEQTRLDRERVIQEGLLDCRGKGGIKLTEFQIAYGLASNEITNNLAELALQGKLSYTVAPNPWGQPGDSLVTHVDFSRAV